MDISHFLLVFLVAFLSSFAQALTGFGSAIVMMALFPLFLPYDVSVMLSLIFCGLMGVGLFWQSRKSLRLAYIFLPVVFSSLGAIVGLFLSAQTPAAIYLRLLGLLLFLLSLWFYFFADRVQIKANFSTGAVSGILSGLLGTIFSISGPPLVLYFNAVTKDKDEYMSALQLCFVILSVIAVAGRTALGLWPSQTSSYLLVCTVGVAAGLLPGIWLYQRVDTMQLKKFIYLFMCAAGLYLAVSAA